jgi:aldehyde dehydrogenase (NAD+)
MTTSLHQEASVEKPQSYSGFDCLAIAGEWRPGHSSRILADRNPYDGAELIQIRQGDRDDLEAAYHLAAATQAAWATELPSIRAAVMRRAAEILDVRREEIISWLIREAGSTRLKANLEWKSTHAILEWATAAPYLMEAPILPTNMRGKEGQVRRKPVGVVSMISPWNWPLHLSTRSVAPALAVGNAVVVKPASDTPVTGGLLLAKIFEEAGLPAGLLSIVVGAGSEIGEAFVTHPVPRVISFTGSTAVGRQIAELAAKAEIIKRVELELGGNGPFVVLEDADLEAAVEAALSASSCIRGRSVSPSTGSLWTTMSTTGSSSFSSSGSGTSRSATLTSQTPLSGRSSMSLNSIDSSSGSARHRRQVRGRWSAGNRRGLFCRLMSSRT